MRKPIGNTRQTTLFDDRKLTKYDSNIEEETMRSKMYSPRVEYRTINVSRLEGFAGESLSLLYNNNSDTFQRSLSHRQKVSRCACSKTMLFAMKSLFFAIAFPICECTTSYQSLRRTTLEHHQQQQQQQQKRNLKLLFMNYEPLTDVKDHSLIDVDRKDIETELDELTEAGFTNARDIYENGANSGVIAKLQLSEALGRELEKETEVSGKSVTKKPQSAKLYENVGIGESAITIKYLTSRDCRVNSVVPDLSGCFDTKGIITLAPPATDLLNMSYSYSIEEMTNNSRTLQGFSTHACRSGTMHKDFKKFYDYYGECDYANKFTLAAFDGVSTDVKNGNADFSIYGREGRGEAIKTALLTMNVWMHVVQKMEDAIESCEKNCSGMNCDRKFITSWDEAVAYYFGSLETGRVGSGNMPYSLANILCKVFGTCGSLFVQQARANFDVMGHFVNGQQNLKVGYCATAKEDKEAIVQIMTVPLLQGTLHSSYLLDVMDEKTEEMEAEAAMYSASVLPMVHACSPESATIIYDNTRVGDKNASTSFKDVKTALESVYNCLDIDCASVGGIVASNSKKIGQKYVEGAGPCGVETVVMPTASPITDNGNGNLDDSANIEFIIGISVSCVLIAALLLAGYEYFFGVRWF